MFSFFDQSNGKAKKSVRIAAEPNDVFKMLDDMDETKRIQELEAELERVGKAFEDYIATTDGLENDVKEELREMRKSTLLM